MALAHNCDTTKFVFSCTEAVSAQNETPLYIVHRNTIMYYTVFCCCNEQNHWNILWLPKQTKMIIHKLKLHIFNIAIKAEITALYCVVLLIIIISILKREIFSATTKLIRNRQYNIKLLFKQMRYTHIPTVTDR